LTLSLTLTLTPEPIVTKFETRDYVADIYQDKKLWINLPRGFCPPHAWNILPKPSKVYFTFFLSSSESLQTRSWDRFSRLIRHTTWLCAR